MGANWKTTVAGLTAAIGFVLTQLSNLLDNDSGTVFDAQGVSKAISVIITLVGMIWLGFKSRDKDVSSEESGIPPARTSPAAFQNAKYGND